MAVFRPPRIHGGGNGATSGVAPDPPSGAFSAGQYHSSLNAWSGRNYGSYEDSGPDLPPVPLEWIIAPLDGSKKCPTPIDTIATFLASALISALCLGAVLGRRTVVNRLTCGRFGEKDGKKRNHLFVWLLGFGLASLGNVFSMLLVTNTKGYEHLHKATIFALYASRPRLTLPLMAALRVLVWRKDHPGPEEDPDAGEFVYVGGYVSSAIAELVLQVVAAGFIGYTWGRFPNKPIKDYMQDTLRYMEILPAVTFICLLIVPIWHLRPTWRGPAQRWLYACMVLLCYVAVITAPWVYWTFFLGLPGSLWCPPNLVGQGVIWAAFDIFAGFFGA